MDNQEENVPSTSRTTRWRAKRRRLKMIQQSQKTEEEAETCTGVQGGSDCRSDGVVGSWENKREDSELEVNIDAYQNPETSPGHETVIHQLSPDKPRNDADLSQHAGNSNDSEVVDECHNVEQHVLHQHTVNPTEMDDDSDNEYDALMTMRGVSRTDVFSDSDDSGESEINGSISQDTATNNLENNPPDGPEDPDDLQNADDSDSDSSIDSTDDGSPPFDCDHLHQIHLQRPVRNVTVKEAVLLKLALALRHNWSYECLIDTFKADNAIFGQKYFPNDKRQLWKILNRNEKCVRFIAYCSVCGDYLGEKKGLPNGPVVCSMRHETNKDKLKFFVCLDLRSQLKKFLGIPGVGAALKYRENRWKDGDALTDIFDGAEYKRLQESGIITCNDFTFVLNTDGFKITKHGKNKGWPIFLRLSELEPSLRQKSIILAGLWIGKKDPIMNTFLRSTVDDLNSLSQTGIKWKPDGVEVTSRFFLLMTSMDSMGRCAVYNMLAPTGYRACIFCDCVGVHLEGCVRYTVPAADEPFPRLRTDASLRENMIEAHDNRRVVAGVKGPSELMNVVRFDLVKGSACDDLHTVFEGVAKHHTELLLGSRVGTMSTAEKLRTIDKRLAGVKPPKNIARPACPISQRAEWSGSEWRNWLFYYCVACLLGIIPRRYIDHLCSLAYAIFLLSQESIQPGDIDIAEQLLKKYVATFQEYFGKENMRFNVHLLVHFSTCVRSWGPLWCYTTFHFESWNFKLMQFVKSPWAPEHQIVTKYLMKSFVELVVFDETISQNVKEQIEDIMHRRRKQVRRVGRSYLLGKGIRRDFSDEERTCLDREGVPFQEATFYRRVIFGESEYRSKDYPKGQHDCSLLYTTQETFCTVESVIVLEHEGTCGLFVTEHDVEIMVPSTYIVQQKPANHDLRHFISIDVVKCPAIKVRSQNNTYMMSISNRREID